MTTLNIQRRLKALGHDPGPLDGIFGALTRRAVAAFQRSRGLDVRWPGTVGPATLAALGTAASDAIADLKPAAEPAGAHRPWFDEAKRLMGIREIAGQSHSPAIMRWAQKLGLWYPDDETPWCGLFVAHCIGSTLPDEPQPGNPLGARSWLTFGVPCEPQVGAILVFSRPGSSWSGHVGFYAGEDASAFSALGGNQSNSVNIARIARSRFLGARWPETSSASATGQVQRSGGGAMSFNEA